MTILDSDELASTPSYQIKRWFSAQWKVLLSSVGVAFLLLLITVMMVARCDSDSRLYVHALWPKRVSLTAEAELVAQLTLDHDKPQVFTGAKAKLYLLKTTGSNSYYGSYINSDQLARQLVETPEAATLIAKGEVEGSGLLKLKLPKVDPTQLQEKGLDAQQASYLSYVLEVEHGGERHYSAARLELGLEPALIALTLDRPLYQPGQVVKMRALVLDGNQHQPRQGKLSFQVRDPKNNLIMDEELALSASGIAHAELALAAEGTQGTYTLVANYAGRAETRQFEVQPFRLPRYKVEVIPWSKELKRGEPLKAQVVATYTYGERVKGAKVEVSLEYDRLGKPAAEQLKGVTDARGVFELEWKLPVQATPGRPVSLIASVTTDTGRAQEGRASVSVAGAQASIEFLPLNKAAFTYNAPNQAVIEIMAAGAPMAEAEVVLHLPEQKGERAVTLKTDAQGRAKFEWTPSSNQSRVSVELTPKGGSTQRLHVSPTLSYDQQTFLSADPVAQVGEPFHFELDKSSQTEIIAVFRRGLPLMSVTMSPGPSGRQGTITFPAEARGLVYLVVMDSTGSRRGVFPVLVRQRGGSKVEITQDKPVYEPGSQAELGLSFAPSGDEKLKPSGDKPPVTYGLVGVDEALYVLKERTELPLETLMRQDPEAIAQLVKALDAIDQEDELGRMLAVTRFQRALGLGQYNNYEMLAQQTQDITRSVNQERTRARKSAWATMLGLMLLALSLIAARTTWQSFKRTDFSFKRLGAFIGIAILSVPVVILLIGVGQERSVMGGLIIWGFVLGGWLLGAAWRVERIKLGRWMALLIAMGVLAALLAFTMDATRRPSSWAKDLVEILLVAPFVLMVVQALLWPFMLVEHKQYQAGYGLATLLALPVLAFGMTAGRRYDAAPTMASRFAEAPMVQSKMTADEEGEAEEMTAQKPPADAPAASAANSGPRVRSYFPETMLWVPELLSDEQGRARQMVEVPDSITTWRVEAWAHTWDGRFGQGKAALKVRKDFFVELELPTQLTQGDRVEVPVTLINQREQAVTAKLSAQAQEGLSIVAGPAPTLEVGPGARETIIVKVLASGVGAGSLTIKAALDDQGAGDGVMRGVTISPDGRTLSRGSAGLVQRGWSEMTTIPADAIDGASMVEVKLFPSPVADALDGLEGMLRKPSGCFEQTSSSNYPNVMISQALKATKPQAWPGGQEAHQAATAKADKLLSLGYQRMLSFQKDDGGFALYPTYESSDLMLTAYGVLQLVEMAKVYPVDAQVIKRATDYLARQQNTNGTWPVYASRVGGGQYDAKGDPGQIRATSFIMMAIASTPWAQEHEQRVERAASHISARYKNTDSPNALALAANAMILAKREALAKEIASSLLSGITAGEQVSYWPSRYQTWMGGYDAYADVETTAIAAAALIDLKIGGEQLPRIITYLAKNRSAYGGWGSTQTTVWTLRTMSKLARQSKEDIKVIIEASGEPMQQASGRGEPGIAQVGPSSMLVQHLVKGALPRGVHKIEIKPAKADDESATMLQMNTRYAVPWSSPAAKLDGERLAMTLQVNDAATFGQAVEVVAQVKNITALDLGAIIVEAPLPPGAYAPREQLEAMVSAGQVDHFEVLPTHVRFYIKGMAQGESLRFGYSFVPLVRGQFSIPAARAFVFYAPEPMTMIDSGELNVR